MFTSCKQKKLKSFHGNEKYVEALQKLENIIKLLQEAGAHQLIKPEINSKLSAMPLVGIALFCSLPCFPFASAASTTNIIVRNTLTRVHL